MERNDLAPGVGSAYIGMQNKIIEPRGESKPLVKIASELAERLNINDFLAQSEEEVLRDRATRSGVPSYEQLKKTGVYRFKQEEPYLAFEREVKDPENHPFRTPSGNI